MVARFVLVVLVTALCPAPASAAGRPDPGAAAKALVARLRPSRLCSFGASKVAAARLIAGLQAQYDFSWPEQNGIVDAGGQRWLIAVVPVGRAPDEGSPAPVGAVIYRWDGAGWVEDGRIARLSHHLNIDYDGGWFVPVPIAPPAVAFELVNSCCTKNVSDRAHSTGVITNTGGLWRVAPLR
jgi:hypothetical protein